MRAGGAPGGPAGAGRGAGVDSRAGRRWRVGWSVLGLLGLLALGVPLAAAVTTGGSGGSTSADPRTQVRDRPAPELSGRTLGGRRFDLAAWRGQVVLVNVWASWCAPCRRELPRLVDARARWSAQGLRVVGINLRDDTTAARDLLAGAGAADLPSVTDPDGAIAVAWGVRGVPETFLVDRDGRVRLHRRGEVTTGWLRRHIPPLLRS